MTDKNNNKLMEIFSWLKKSNYTEAMGVTFENDISERLKYIEKEKEKGGKTKTESLPSYYATVKRRQTYLTSYCGICQHFQSIWKQRGMEVEEFYGMFNAAVCMAYGWMPKTLTCYGTPSDLSEFIEKYDELIKGNLNNGRGRSL